MSVMHRDRRLDQPNFAAEPVFAADPPRVPRDRHRAHPGRLLAAGVAAAVLVGIALESVPPDAPGHQLWTNIVAAAPLTAPPVAAVPPPVVDPQLSAIQQVIQQANTEQIQAIATQNPSVMSDTATPAHYQQLVQINQDLVAQGVTSIQLTDLSWGPIAINGSTRTATSYETWVTAFSDSTTMQSTDTNVYTLVQQGGSWIIQDDQQPTATPGRPSTAQPAPGQPSPAQPAPLPAVPNPQNTSHNWSGYASTSSQTYTGVSGTWTVPQLTPSGAPGVGATWVGIGGVTSRDLIQAGTQDVASGSGQAQFQAWIETLPQASRQVPLVVAPGDSVTVSIDEQGVGSGVWQIAFMNNTSGQTYQTTVNYTSSQSSAEWIEEAPSGPNGVVPLDNFGSVAFTSASATVNGQTVDLTQAGAKPITMLSATSQPLAVPSAIGTDGTSFSVARTSASATPPPVSTGRRGFAPTN
jgi:hypothetical protein